MIQRCNPGMCNYNSSTADYLAIAFFVWGPPTYLFIFNSAIERLACEVAFVMAVLVSWDVLR